MPRVLRTGLTISPAGSAVGRLRTAVQRDEDSRRPLISAFVFHAREVATIAHPCFIWQLVSFLAVYEFDPTARDVLSRAEFYLTIPILASFRMLQARPGSPLGEGDRRCARIRWKKIISSSE